MVKYSPAALDHVFGALADPTRRAILARLAGGQTSLSELARPFVEPAARTGQSHQKMSLVAVQKHVRVLERAGLVETEKEGRVRRCMLQPKPLRNAAEWIEYYEKFWEDQFDALEQFITDMQKEDASWRPRPAKPHRPRAAGDAPSAKEKPWAHRARRPGRFRCNVSLPRRAKKFSKRGRIRD
jgi:DNA-binding transcriptional ArsR family regulator